MILKELHEMGTEIERWLRMRAHPIGVKLLRGREEIPKGSIVPTSDWGHKYALCQSFARSQRNGETIAMFKEDNWCPGPVVGLGFSERIPYFLEGYHRYPDGAKNIRAASEWCKNMPYIEYGLYKGIVSAPINTCTFIPDVIVMHVNSLMTSALLNLRAWIDGKDIYAQLSGHNACTYAVVPSFLHRECHVTIPCKGDRCFAHAQDDEIIFSIVPEMLPDFIDGTKWLDSHGWQIPEAQAYKEEYDLKRIYKNFAERLGMDVTQSPQRPQKFRE